MLTYQNHTVRTSVRKLVEFLLRSGDITTGAALTADTEAMQEGSRLHRKIQKAQKTSYQSEVPLKMTWHQTDSSTGEEYELILEGRADGIDRIKNIEEYIYAIQSGLEIFQEERRDGDRTSDIRIDYVFQSGLEILPEESVVLIDEIKCVYRDVTQIEEAELLHLAQAKCYAYMYGVQKELPYLVVQITYCNIETEDIRRVAYFYPMEKLEEWFQELLDGYRLWADYAVASRKDCMESIHQMQFPFAYRPGQKKMAAMVYHAVEQKNHMFLQAPTGTGKTISAIYPSLKQLEKGQADRIFYLTAKTITRTVAEDTLHLLTKQKLKLHSVTITAKERICIKEEPECDPNYCDRAKGHYDRINQALYQILTKQEQITREVVLKYADRFQVCPYELGFEVAAWSECVICDYNYVFDPHVNVRGLFGENNRKRQVLLIDEAHNFLDRARSMYSADLKREELILVRKRFQEKNRFIVKKLQNVLKVLSGLEKMEKTEVEDALELTDEKDVSQALSRQADKLYLPLMRLLGPMEDYLKDHPAFEERDEIVQIFFRLRHFYMILEQKEEGYQVYSTGTRKNYTLHLYCVDPSGCIEEYLEKSRASVFFSATLLPIQYYRQLLGGQSGFDAFCIPSPFPKDRRLLAVTNDVTSRYSRRGEEQYKRIIRYLEMTVEEKKGNYMIFFPSYEMLLECESIAREHGLEERCDLLIQNSSMKEEEREHFLMEFAENRPRSLVGFCVLGSLFSEGIDLAGDRLIGVLIVGTGLPQVCREREIIRTFFDTHGKKGYDYAYRYPGMNKVLQAAGRVIRREQDKGLILLMDDRFLWKENQALLPEEWDSFYEVSLRNYSAVLRSFWENQDNYVPGDE